MADRPTTSPSAADDDLGPTPLVGAARGHRRLRRVLLAFGALLLVMGLVVGGSAWYLVHRYSSNIDRVGDVFADVPAAARPAAATPVDTAAAQQPVTFLIVGSDTREEISGDELPDARSDLIMLARLSADRQHVQVISIPRDSWVDIPGHGKDKINAAYAYGGPSLLIQTVENLTSVRIDHYAAIGFEGLIDITDALGGIDVDVPTETTWGPHTFTAGINHLDGEGVRWYVGQRHGLPGGDFDRVRRQQNFLRAMFTKLFSAGTFDSLGTLDTVLTTVTSNIAVDDSLSATALLQLAWSAHGVTPDDVQFFTAPVLGTGMEGSASVVYLDATTGGRMWQYLQSDSLYANAGEFTDEALGAVVN